MAEIDPRIRQFEEEAAKTLAAMKRSAKRAEAFEKDVERGRDSRRKLDQRVRQEVAKDRIKGETLGESSRSTRKSSQALQEQSRATRNAATEQQKLTRLNKQAEASEQRLTRQRRASTRAILTQEQAIKRYGQFAGQRYIQQQGPGASVLTRDEARALAVQRQGEFAGGGGFDRRYPPPPPPPPPTGGGGRGGGFGEGPKRFNAELAKERQNLKALEGQLAKDARAHQRLIQVQAGGSNVLRRNGALTTEFIQAAARGEVTIRELGYQTASTIGKFGGWITAGAALYTALGAVQKMGAGALSAYSGVNQLQRVINNVDASSARKEFSELADYFQLPYEDVTAGVYEVGKVFHDQNAALEASKALLYSVKVGELDVATAGRYLISITNAYNLSQSDLNNTFDKFNQLQNNFGVAIAGTEAATARAAGSYANAGGELDYLISLIGTASRVTGAAPERVGTALQRAPSFIHKPGNEQTLKALGINPNQDIDNIFEEAFKVAESSSGKRRRQLAAALFGPQYGAGVGTPLLRQYDLFQKIQKSVARSKGSGARELATLKGSPEEQLKNIGVQLERLGTGLAESGLVSVIAGVALGLDDVLRVTNSLLTAFNGLPDGLKTSLGLMIQLGLAARLLGRLNVGDSLSPQGKQVGSLRTFGAAALGGGDRRDARLIRKGLYGEKTALEEQKGSFDTEAREQASRAELAQKRAADESKRRITLSNQGALNEAKIAESKAVEAQYIQEANVSREASIRAGLDAEQKAARLNQVEKQITAGRGRFGGLNVARTLSAADVRGGYAPSSFDVPTTAAPSRYGRQPISAGGPGYGAVIPHGGIPATPIDLAQLGKQEKEVSKATQVARRTASRLRGTRVGAARLGNAFNSVIGNMGNLIFAAFTIGTIGQLLSEQVSNFNEELENANRPTDSAKTEAQRLREIVKGPGHGTTTADRGNDLLAGAGALYGLSPLGAAQSLITGHGFDPKGNIDALFGGGPSSSDLVKQEEQVQRWQIEARRQQQQKARRQGRPIPQRYVKDITEDIENLQTQNVPTKQARKLIAKYREELAISMEATGQAAGTGKEHRKRLQQARTKLEEARFAAGGPGTLRESLEGLEPKEIQEQLASEVTQAGQYGGLTKDRIRRARTAYQVLQGQLGASTAKEDVAQLAEARDQFFDGLQGAIQAELDHNLALAKTPGARNAAYTSAFSQLRQAYTGGNREAIAQSQQRVRNLQRQLRDAPTELLRDQDSLLGKGVDFLGLNWKAKGPEAISGLKRQLGAEKEGLKELREDRRQKREFFRQVRDELRQQQYEENAALREAQTQLKVSRTADPLAQAKIKLAAINTEIGKAIEVFGRSSKEVLELLGQRQEILAQQAQDQVNLIEAQGALKSASLSGEGNETAKARSELQTLQTKLGYEQSHANRFDPAEILQLQAEVREAQIALQEQIEQEAEELFGAALDVRIARAEAGGNDVRAARLNVAKARYEFRHADTKLEKRQSRADLIGKRASLRDATNSREIEDIEFQADIGKLTIDQQIAAYQRLLNTQKLTRDARRDLRRKIYALRHETEDEGTFELNVGSIKLPTVYEIRRAVKGGVNGGGVQVTQSNQYHINGAGDPRAVALEINRLNGGANKAALRSAGIR